MFLTKLFRGSTGLDSAGALGPFAADTSWIFLVSCLGSFQVVVRLLWSTKKGQPVCGSIFTSQPSGRGSLSLVAMVGICCGCVFTALMFLQAAEY